MVFFSVVCSVTPTVDMEMLHKLGTRQKHIYHSDSLACQGHFREEGRYGGGRYFDFPCWEGKKRTNNTNFTHVRGRVYSIQQQASGWPGSVRLRFGGVMGEGFSELQ